MKIKMITLLSIALSFLLGPAVATADDHEDRKSLSDVWFVVPKAGSEGAFEEALSAHMAFRAESGEPRSWEAYTVVVGDKINVYMFRSCCYDWADHDEYEEAMADSPVAADWNEKVHPHVDHYHHYYEKYDYENSNWPVEDDRGPYFGVTTWTVKQGAGPEAGEARKKMSQMALENGWGEIGGDWLWHTRIGGAPKLMIVSSFESYADMAPPETSFAEFMAEHMSEEDLDKLFKAFGTGFADSSYTVWKLRPELSTPDGS